LIALSCTALPAAKYVFYRATLSQSAVMRLRVVCPSVCPSVKFRYRDHIGWNTSKEFRGRIHQGHCSQWPQRGRSGAAGTPQN